MTHLNNATDNAQAAIMENQSGSLSFVFLEDHEAGQMNRRTRRNMRRNRRWDACGF